MQNVIQFKNRIMINVIVVIKIIVRGCICQNSTYLKIIVDNPVTAFDGIVSITSGVSTNVTNTASTNVTSTSSKNVTSIVSINSDDKEVRYKMDYYILSKFLSVTVLLFIIVFIYYY